MSRREKLLKSSLDPHPVGEFLFYIHLENNNQKLAFYLYIIYIYENNKLDMKGTHLGEFEELVLLTIAILYDEAYGLAIQREMERQTKRSISIGAVHAACNRLADKGFLESRFSEASQKRGGKRKKLYKVSYAGQQALSHARDLRQQLWDQIPGTAFQFGLS